MKTGSYCCKLPFIDPAEDKEETEESSMDAAVMGAGWNFRNIKKGQKLHERVFSVCKDVFPSHQNGFGKSLAQHYEADIKPIRVL